MKSGVSESRARVETPLNKLGRNSRTARQTCGISRVAPLWASRVNTFYLGKPQGKSLALPPALSRVIWRAGSVSGKTRVLLRKNFVARGQAPGIAKRVTTAIFYSACAPIEASVRTLAVRNSTFSLHVSEEKPGSRPKS
jgi:hypothetical protein